MFGPDPAVLFGTPVVLMIIVLVVGLAVYYYPKEADKS